MTPGQLINHVRSFYIETLTDGFDRHKVNPTVTVQTEAALRELEGNLLLGGPLGLPVRVDVVTFEHGRLTDTLLVEPDQMPSFDVFTLQWEETLPVKVGPFSWHACVFVIGGIKAESDPSPIVEWYMKWFDPEDEKPADEQGVYRVVHHLDGPGLDADGNVRCVVDFGSAPLECFERFLDALKAVGATEVSVGKCS
jgi:hypothetical protein